LTNHNKCCAVNIEFDKLKVKNNSVTETDISTTTAATATIIQMQTQKHVKEKEFINSNVALSHPYEKICNDILEILKNPNDLVFLSFRDMLYDILIYNHDLGECIWYILNNLIKTNYLQMGDLSDILINTYASLQYFNNNYRPIYHLENYMYNLISKIHGF
jgi:hypothetical protein